MANVHASIKAMRQSARRRVRNQAVLSELKTLWRKFSELPASETTRLQTLAREMSSKWDRAVSGGMVPKGRANRKKARLARRLKKLNTTS